MSSKPGLSSPVKPDLPSSLKTRVTSQPIRSACLVALAICVGEPNSARARPVWRPSCQARFEGATGAILTVCHHVPVNPEHARSAGPAHGRVRSRPVPSAFRQMTSASM